MIPFRNYRTAADEFSITDLRASFSDQMNAQVQLSHHDAIGVSALRNYSIQQLNEDSSLPRLSADEALRMAEERLGPLSEQGRAELRGGQYTEPGLMKWIESIQFQRAQQAIIGDNNGFLRGGALMAVGFVVPMVSDPVEAGIALIPGGRFVRIGAARLGIGRVLSGSAAQLEREVMQQSTIGRIAHVGRGVATDLVDNVIMNTAREVPYYHIRQMNPLDNYSLQDSFKNVAVGSVAGVGINRMASGAYQGVRRLAGVKPQSPMHPGLVRLLHEDRQKGGDLLDEVLGVVRGVDRLPMAERAAVLNDIGDTLVMAHQLRQPEGAAGTAGAVTRDMPAVTEHAAPPAARGADMGTPADAQPVTAQDRAQVLSPQVQRTAEFLAQQGNAPAKVGQWIEHYTRAWQDDLKTHGPASRDADGGQVQARRERVMQQALEWTQIAPERGVDQLRSAAPETRRSVAQAAVVQMVQGQQLDVRPVLDADAGKLNSADMVGVAQRSHQPQNQVGYDARAALQARQLRAEAAQRQPVDNQPPGRKTVLARSVQELEQAIQAHAQQQQRRQAFLAPVTEKPAVTERAGAMGTQQAADRMPAARSVQSVQSVALVQGAVRDAFGRSSRRLLEAGRVKVVASVADVPGGPYAAGVKTVLRPDGDVYMVADNVSGPEVKGILLHQLGVRTGFERMVGPQVLADIRQQLDDALLRSEPWAQRARAQVPRYTPEGAVHLEMLANVVQHYPDLSLVQQVKATVRSWVYRHFGTARQMMALTDADLSAMALAALRNEARHSRSQAGPVPGQGDVSGGQAGKPVFAEQIAAGEHEIATAQRTGAVLVEAAHQAGDMPHLAQVLEQRLTDVPPQQVRAVLHAMQERMAAVQRQRFDGLPDVQDLDTRPLMQEMATGVALDLEQRAMQQQRVRLLDESKFTARLTDVESVLTPAQEQVQTQTRTQTQMQTQMAAGKDGAGAAGLVAGEKAAMPDSRNQPVSDTRAFVAMLLGDSHAAENKVSSVRQLGREYSLQWEAFLRSDALEGGSWRILADRRHARDIYRVLADKATERDLSGYSPQVRDAADSVMLLNQHIREQLQAEGVYLNAADDVLMPQVHDSARLSYAGYAQWRDFVIPRLDMERTFLQRGVRPGDGVLKAVFDALQEGAHERVDASRVLNGILHDHGRWQHGGAQAPASDAFGHWLYFKNADAQFEYQRAFGTSDVLGMLAYHIRHQAQRLALVKRFGTQPQAMLERLVDGHYESLAADPVRAALFSAGGREIDDAMRLLDGSATQPGHELALQWQDGVQNYRAVQQLGQASSSLLQDLPQDMAALYAPDGDGLLTHAWRTIAQPLTALNGAEQKRALQSMQFLGQSIMGQLASQVDAPGLMAGKLFQGLHNLFGWDAQSQWQNVMRRAFTVEYAALLAGRSDRRFDVLPQRIQSLLTAYDVDAGRWDLLRQAVSLASDGRRFLAPEALAAVPDGAFAKDLLARGQEASAKAIASARAQLADSYRALLRDQMNGAVGALGSRRVPRASLYDGTLAGTAEGELVRVMQEFDSVANAMLYLTWGDGVYSKNVQAMAEFVRDGTNPMTQIANSMTLAGMLHYVGDCAQRVLQGKNPQSAGDAYVWQQALEQSGAAGFYADYLYAQAYRQGQAGGSAEGDYAGGYGAMRMDHLQALYASSRRGDAAAASELGALLYNTPSVDLFYSRQALDYLVTNRIQEALNPGEMKAQLMREVQHSMYMRYPERLEAVNDMFRNTGPNRVRERYRRKGLMPRGEDVHKPLGNGWQAPGMQHRSF